MHKKGSIVSAGKTEYSEERLHVIPLDENIDGTLAYTSEGAISCHCRSWSKEAGLETKSGCTPEKTKVITASRGQRSSDDGEIQG